MRGRPTHRSTEPVGEVVAKAAHELGHLAIRLQHPAKEVREEMLVGFPEVPTLQGLVEQTAQPRVCVGARIVGEFPNSVLRVLHRFRQVSDIHRHLRLRSRESLGAPDHVEMIAAKARGLLARVIAGRRRRRCRRRTCLQRLDPIIALLGLPADDLR